MEYRDYTKLLPEPPAGLLEWCKEQAGKLKHEELLVYKYYGQKKGADGKYEKSVQLTCSRCHGTAKAKYKAFIQGCHYSYPPAPFAFIHPELGGEFYTGQDTLCPVCGAEVLAVHVENLRTPRDYCVFPMTIQRIEDKLVLMGWCVKKLIDRNAQTTYRIHMYEAYVIEKSGIIRLTAHQQFCNSFRLDNYWTQRKEFRDSWKETPLVFPWEPSLLIGSTAENCKLDLYQKCAGDLYPVSYMRLWQKRPAVENLLVQGTGNIIAEMIRDEFSLYKATHVSYYTPSNKVPILKLQGINWKERRPAQMLGLTKDEFDLCKRLEWDCADLKFYKDAKEAKWNMKLPGDMAECKAVGYFSIPKIDEAKLPIMPTVRYLAKQKKIARGLSIDLQYLQDYWRMAAKNGLDVSLKSVKWPKDLKAAHDRHAEIERIKANAKKAEQLREKFEKRLLGLAKYSYEQAGLLIRPAATFQEFVDEGKYLNNCVAGYAERHARGETTLFWIRKADAPGNPYFALEFDIKHQRVQQNRGKSNCSRTPEVKAFEEAWLKWVAAGCLRDETGSPIEGPPKKSRKKKEATAA